MPGTTPYQALPYPTGTDTPAGMTEIQALAVALEPKLVMAFSSAADRASKIVTPTEGMLSWLNDANRFEYHNGTAWKRIGAAGDQIGCRIRRNATQPINSAASTPVNFDTQDEDTDNFFTPTSPTITIPSGLDGSFAVLYRQILSASPTGRSFAEVALTSSIPNTPTEFRFPGNTTENGRIVAALPGIPLAGGDTITVNTFQTSAGPLNLTAWMSVYRVGD